MKSALIIGVGTLALTACGDLDEGTGAGADSGATQAPEQPSDEPEVPQACLEALDLAEEGFTHTSEAMGAMSEGFLAASEFDTAGVEAARLGMEDATSKITALRSQMASASSDCRQDENSPKVCITALDHGAAGFNLAARVFESGSRAFDAASRLDVAGIEAEAAVINERNAEIETLAPKFNLAKVGCRAGS